MADPMSDDRLEALFREGLRARAQHAPTTLRPVRRPGRTSAAHRRRLPWAVGAAAVAVVAVAVPVGTRLLADRGAVSGPPAASSAPADVRTPASWRWESYAGVELRVPPAWGWGGTPVSPGAGESGYCEVKGATVTSTGERDVNASAPVPYVGRPVLQSDACSLMTADQLRSDVDAVWFGSPLPVGEKDDAKGRLSRTATVGRVRVTVFAADRMTIARVLASARPVGAADANGCTPDPAKAYAASGARPSTAPTALVVCAYTSPDPSGRRALLFSATRDAAAATAYRAAVRANADAPPTCAAGGPGELVVVGVRSTSGMTWDRVSLAACPHITRATGGGARVVADTVRPWSGPEAKAYLVGPFPSPAGSDQALLGLFRGILG